MLCIDGVVVGVVCGIDKGIVNSSTFDQFRYVILSGHVSRHGADLSGLYEKAYQHWKGIWERTFTRLDGKGTFRADDFCRYDYISNIFHGDEIVAQICGRTLNLRHSISYDLAYFQDFRGKALTDLEVRGVRDLLTLELNSINPRYSKRRAGFAFAEAMYQLSGKLAKELGMGCCTAAPRKLTGVQNDLNTIGYRLMEGDVIVHSCPVDIMLGYTNDLCANPDVNLQNFVDFIWNTRLQYNRPALEVQNQVPIPIPHRKLLDL